MVMVLDMAVAVIMDLDTNMAVDMDIWLQQCSILLQEKLILLYPKYIKNYKIIRKRCQWKNEHKTYHFTKEDIQIANKHFKGLQPSLLVRQKLKLWVKSLSHVWLFVTPWIVVYQAPPSTGFSKQESALPFPSSGNLSDPRIEPRSDALQADS